jgi:peptidoglycan/LPS O-acetylase OafA/YrhL
MAGNNVPMGLCRFLLAMAVFAAHVPSPKGLVHLTGAKTAVEGFFVISGYLMALIQGQRKYRNKTAFWKSRFLRIYPIYWMVLALSLLASLLIPEIGRPYLKSALEFSLLNFFLIGLDVVIILALTGGPTSTSNVIVPQSWTLSLELYFYVLMPFLSKLKTKWLATTCAAVLATKFLLYLTTGLRDPWSYRFFPLEIGFFLWGMLMYRIAWKLPRYSEVVFLLIWLFGSLYRLDSPLLAHEWQSMIFPLLLGVTLNGFAKWDKVKAVQMLGKLSYPIYLVHLLVGTVTVIVLRRMHVSLGVWPTYLLILALVLALSYSLVKFVEDPIDQVRKRFASSS